MFGWWVLGVWAAAPEGLRPVMATPDTPERYRMWRLVEQLPEDDLACEPIWPDTALLCFRLWENGKRRWVGESDLRAWRTNVAALEAQVAAHAGPKLQAAELVPIEGMNTTYLRLVDGDGWAAAGLLHPELLAERLGGLPIRVAVPNDTVLVAWKAQGKDVDQVMAVGVRELYDQQSGGVSPQIRQWDGESWLPFGQALPVGPVPRGTPQ